MYTAADRWEPATWTGVNGPPLGVSGLSRTASGTSTAPHDSAWHWVRLVLLLCILLGIGALIAPSRFGGPMTYAVVTGHSMEPVMHDGALAVARTRSEYQLGQTVIYDRYGGHVMHRLVFYEPGHGWVTQGDNNDWVDGWFVPEQNIRGEVIFTIPAVGGWLRDASTHPLILVVLAGAVAGACALPRKRRRVTPALAQALAQAEPEPVPVALTSNRLPQAMSLGVMGLALSAALISLARQAPLWPTQAIAFGALLACVIGFDVLQTVTQDAWGTSEPDRSTLVLAPVSRRMYVSCSPGTSVTPGRQLVPVTSAVALRDLAETNRLPVLHRVDVQRGYRDYVLVTQGCDYVWVPPGISDRTSGAPVPGTGVVGHPSARPVESGEA